MASIVHNVLDKLHMSGSKQEQQQLPEPTEEELTSIRAKYKKAGQEHVFTFWDQLSSSEKGSLYSQLLAIDPEHNNRIAAAAISPPKTDPSTAGDSKPQLEPLPKDAVCSIIDSDDTDLAKWYASGLELISKNEVGVVLMAGGQGTRLGSSAPKGCYDVGLPSHKSLFQLQAERIWKIQRLAAKAHGRQAADVAVPWYIMTSGPTRTPTEEFFEKHAYFGLNRNNVVFFEQGTLPCITRDDAKILLESRSRVAVAPDGNGGLYRALLTSGVVGDLKRRGIKHVHAYCVDNSLVRVADPTFLGFAAAKSVSIATKVVRKRDAAESVGLIVSRNGRPDVVEYSEIDAETAAAKDAHEPSLLKYRAANIVNHYYSFAFLDSIPTWVDSLPHHVAHKKIPYLDPDSGQQVKPERPNGIKLEQFVFDCFPLLEDMSRFASMEVRREDEFSPLKNGMERREDNAETSRRHVLQQGRRWVEAAGGTVVSEGSDGSGEGVEISPKISYGGEGLDFVKGRTIKAPAVIEKDD